MKDKDLTVVIVNDFDYIQGGASKVAIDTAKLLHKNKVNVIYFSATHKKNDYPFKQITTNQKECLTDGIKGAIRGIYNFKAAKEFTKLLKTLDRNKTIIHVHGWTKSLSSSIFRIANKENFKVILTLHDYFTVCPNGGFFNYKKCKICKKKAMSLDCMLTNCDSRNYLFKIYRCIRQFVQNINIKKSDNLNIVSISDFSFDKLKNYDLKKLNIEKIYNPISIEKNKRVNIEKNKYYIYVGRISQEKGVDIFCKAIDELKLDAIVVGDGSEKCKLEKKYNSNKIKFVGWQDTASVEKYFQQAKCLVFPSRWYEGAPLTILEALSKGIPCIVSNQCAGIEFINKNNGIIYDGTTSEDLKNKILKYEKLNIKELGEKTYNYYWEKPYDESRYISNIINFYYKCIKKQG